MGVLQREKLLVEAALSQLTDFIPLSGHLQDPGISAVRDQNGPLLRPPRRARPEKSAMAVDMKLARTSPVNVDDRVGGGIGNHVAIAA